MIDRENRLRVIPQWFVIGCSDVIANAVYLKINRARVMAEKDVILKGWVKVIGWGGFCL